MRKKLINIFLLTLISGNTFADNICQSTPGSLFCSKGTISALPWGMYGKISLDGTNITGTTSAVTGFLKQDQFG